jgi:hypothetical protein
VLAAGRTMISLTSTSGGRRSYRPALGVAELAREWELVTSFRNLLTTKLFRVGRLLRARFGCNKQGHPVVRWQVNGEAVQIIDDGKMIAAEHI